MENALFIEISLVVTVAFLIASLMRALKQPLIISYIISGLLLGPYFFDAIASTYVLETVSHLGIAMLLFIIGLGLNPKQIKDVGKPAITIGIGQIVITAALGFLLAYAFGYLPQTSIYIALAMTLSSTAVILKTLSDKKDTARLYGKISLGFLLVQDLVAAGILVYIASVGAGGPILLTLLEGLGWLTLIGGGLFLISQYMLPKISGFLAGSQEYLFLFAVAWGLGVSALVALAGLSIEIGALLAGVTLSTQIYAREMSSRLRPLRDFFLLFFFITLGAGLDLGTFSSILLPVIAFAIFELVINPLILMSLAGFFGYKKRTSFKTAVTAGQVSEFSLVFILLALEVGEVTDEVVALVTLVALVTIAGSTYMMHYDDLLYEWFEDWLSIFERKKTTKTDTEEQYADIFLFGYTGSSRSFMDSFQRMDYSYMVIDYDPEKIDDLKKKNIDHHYGDATDPEFMESIHVDEGILVISTINDFDTNLALVKYMNRVNPDTVVVAFSEYPAEAAVLYENGATYVIMPHFLGSEHVMDIIDGDEITDQNFFKHRDDHLRYLQSRLE
jgi:Kef-type K+ transport system membrane component KefB